MNGWLVTKKRYPLSALNVKALIGTDQKRNNENNA
jgi:hypothetical protein